MTMIEDFEIEVVKLSEKEKGVLIRKCIQGLKSKNLSDVYQATAAAEFVGRDKRLIKPLIKAFRKHRGLKRELVLQAIRNLGYEKEIRRDLW